jgi:O-antigen ligase
MFSKINSQIEGWNKWMSRENLILGVVFLFPLAGTFVRHWISDLFVLLLLLSLFFHKKSNKNPLTNEEKVFLAGFLAYFVVFILTSLVNGWREEQTDWLLLELRFLAIIPIYLMLREIPQVGRALLFGALLGIILTFCWSMYELYIMSPESYMQLANMDPVKRRLNGVYSVLFIGPYVLLLSSFVIPAVKLLPQIERQKWIAGFLLLAGLFMVVKSGARNAYLGLIAASVVTGFYYYHSRKAMISFIVVFIMCLGIWYFSDTVKMRINSAVNQFELYTSTDDHVDLKQSAGSVGKRLELWRAAIIMFKDNPIFGIGRGNFNAELEKLVNEGIINPAVKEYSQPHNLFLEVAVSRGILGLVTLIWILYYPLVVFIKTRKSSTHTALLGILHILVISVLSLTEAAAFIKGNFVATYLVFLGVFFLWHIRKVHNNSFTELRSQ